MPVAAECRTGTADRSGMQWSAEAVEPTRMELNEQGALSCSSFCLHFVALWLLFSKFKVATQIQAQLESAEWELS
jgi:hypothetical protein